MPPTTLFVCALCQFKEDETPTDQAIPAGMAAGQYLLEQLQQQLQASPWADQISLQSVRCMAACDRPCNLALTAPGKLTFILRDLPPLTAAPQILAFCQQYLAWGDGKVPYATRSQLVKQSTVYVLPPLPDLPGNSP
ncbi:MAG: DUF1636 domain-containing protein [Nodosilinea sp.]